MNSKDCHGRLGIRPRGVWLVRAAALMLAGLLPGLAGALTAGQIGVLSHLNEPFRATVPLSALQIGEVGELKVGLADDSAYRALGLEKTNFLHSLQFEVRESDASDQATLLITTTQTAKEPFFSMLLAFDGMSGKLIREYTVLLDPNTGSASDDSTPAPMPVAEPVAATTEVMPSAPQAMVPQAATQAPPLLAETQPVVRQGSAPVVAAQPFRSGAAERKVPVPTPSVRDGVAAETGATAATGPVVYENAPVSYASEFGPVKAGMTLWQIAAAVRPNPSVTMNQVMWGLYSNNPAQFDGNLNLVKRGAMLNVPSVQALRDVSPAEASALVADQAQQHRDLLAGASTSTSSAATQSVPVERVRPTPVPVKQPSVLPAARNPKPAAPAPDIQEPAQQPLHLVEEEPVIVPSESVLPAAQDTQVEDSAADADDYAELETLPTEDAQQSSDYAELPSLPMDEVDGEMADDAMADDELSEAAYDEPMQDGGSEQYPNLLGVGLAALGVLVLGLLVVLGLRRRNQDADDGPVSDFASPAPPPRKPVSDFAAPAAATQIDELEDTTDFDATATSDLDDSLTQELEPTATQDVGHDTQDFEIPDLDDFVGAGGQAGDSTDEFDQTAKFDQPQTPEVDFGDTAVQQPAVAPEVAPDEMDFSELESATQTLDLGSETVSLELNEDPLSEADFQLAYGLYDEAALLLNRAIESEPDRLDLREKLVETHFAASDAAQFKQAAETLKGHNPDAETWQRIAIMGQQLCPGDELFSAVGDDASGALDVDMAFDAPDTDSAASVDAASATSDDNVLEFTLDDVADPESSATAQTQGSDENALEFELDDATVAQSPDTLSSVEDDYEADFGEFGEDTQSSVELSELDDLNLDDLEAELDADDLIESAAGAVPDAEPSAASASSGMEDFADLTISDVSHTELVLDTESEDASDVIGSNTEFDLELPQDETEQAGFETEFDLADSTSTQTAGGTEDFSLSDIDLGDDAAAEATSDDLTLSVDEPDLSLSDDDLTIEDIQAATSDDALDLDDFDLTESDTAQATDFSLDEVSLDETLSGDADDLSDLTLNVDDDLGTDLSGAETDFNLDDLGADAQEVAGGDESATKLDLARAYADMGESDMAKNLLNEVVTAGSDEQKAVAQELLSKL